MTSSVVQFLLISSVISSVFSIQCYQCNSMWDGKCGEIFRESPTNVVDCDKEAAGLVPEIKATFCRKILQKSEKLRRWWFNLILIILAYGHVRVIRSCGFVLNKPSKQNNCEFYSFVKASESTYCECDKDLCNGSFRLNFGLKLPLLFIFAPIVKKTFH